MEFLNVCYRIISCVIMVSCRSFRCFSSILEINVVSLFKFINRFFVSNLSVLSLKFFFLKIVIMVNLLYGGLFVYFVIELIVCLGRYFVCRFVEVGCNDIFIVFGDFNFILLDYFLNELGINNIGCCNEINVGYVVDGYV